MAKRISKSNAIASFVQTGRGQALLHQCNDKIEFEYELRAYIDEMDWYVGAYGRETSENDIEGSANYTAKIAQKFGYSFAEDYEEEDAYYEDEDEYEDDEDYDEDGDYGDEAEYDEDEDYEEEDDYVEAYEAPRVNNDTSPYFNPTYSGGMSGLYADTDTGYSDTQPAPFRSVTAEELRAYADAERYGSSQNMVNAEPYMSPADRAVQGLKSKTADEVRQEIARQRYGLEGYYGGGESAPLPDMDLDAEGYDDENQFDGSERNASHGMLPIFIILLAVFMIWKLLFHG